jgi:hypothetical protein
MNLLLHGLGNEKNMAAGKDSLVAKPSVNYDMVLTNPPFGKKSSVTIVNQDGDEVKERQEILRDDFWATTGNKQLNFLQHVRSLLKINGRADLDDFVSSYNPANRHQRSETERFRCFSYEDLLKRDKANLDIFWLRDDSLGDSSDLPDPAVLAAEIVEDLQAALDQFAQIAADLSVPEP